MVSDVPHPAEKPLAVNLVNGEVVLFEKLIKFQAHQFNINVSYTHLNHGQTLVLVGLVSLFFSRYFTIHGFSTSE